MSSGFISEAEIAEQRRIRQEEWERVRTADQPLGHSHIFILYVYIKSQLSSIIVIFI